MRLSVSLLALFAVTGCGKTRACKDHTVLFEITLDDAATAADSIVMSALVDGATLTATAAHAPGAAHGTLEADFPNGYPQGKTVTFTLTAYSGMQPLARSAPAPATLSGSCAALPVQVVSFPATARLIAPASTSTVATRAPTLRWQLGPGAGTPIVDLCQDRTCSLLVNIPVTMASDHRSARLAMPLPTGITYWRVRVGVGNQTALSPVWQFYVGKLNAPIDSDSGVTLDVNGDGFADALVGAESANANRGAAHLYLGSATPDGAAWNRGASRVDLTDPSGGGAHYGNATAAAGDVDGDGYADFLVGAYAASASGGGAFLYFGAAAPSAANWQGAAAKSRIDLSGPDGANGNFGAALSAAGAAHLYLGRPASASDWNDLAPPNRLDLASRDGASGEFGRIVAAAGDVNGDGYADFLVSAPGASSGAGAAHLYLGGAMPSAADWGDTNAARRVDLTSPDGAAASFGYFMAPAGDVNGDGFSDFVIGAYAYKGTTGAAHLYLGSASVAADSWNGPGAAKRIDLVDPDGGNAAFGIGLAGAGDLNGDGYADFLIGAANAASNNGAIHVYLGDPSPVSGIWNGATPMKRIDLPCPDAGNAYFGASVAGAGDVNGDGLWDFIAGAPSANGSGAAHLFLGDASPSVSIWSGAKRLDLTSPDGLNGAFGTSVASRSRRRLRRENSGLCSWCLPSALSFARAAARDGT